MKVQLNPPSLKKRILCGAFVAVALAVVLSARGEQSKAVAAETPRADAAPAGVFDSIVATNTERPSAPCAGTAAVRWLPKSNITINFVRGEFTDAEKSALREAIDLWQRALSRSTLGIVFVSGADVDRDAAPSLGQIIVRRDYQMEQNRFGRIVASARADNYLDRASILVNGSVNKKKVLRKLFMHELGHALGLRDCSDCGSGQSVMNHFTRKSFFGVSIRDSNLANKPSASDVAQVVSGYNQSAPRFAEILDAPPETITADETVTVTDANVAREVNILAAYIGGAQTGKDITQLSYASRVLPSNDKSAVESQLAALFQVESATMEELKSYTFHRDVRIQTIDDKGRVSGEYRRASDMLLDDTGRRIEKNIVLSPSTLRGFEVTNEYVEDFSGAQLKGFELRQRPLYRFEPFGSDTVEGKAARIYRITPDVPAATATSARVLYGFVWADQSTGAILKVAGLALPEQKQRFPLFETRRAMVEGKYLFPAVTIADDYLVFPSRRVHVRMLITYSDYRRFGSRVTITEIADSQP